MLNLQQKPTGSLFLIIILVVTVKLMRI
ncbi:MAG: cytochrome c oxidase subunit 2A [Psychroserpens sp.]|nr:cytochrome c oxidase subunit 2A [Psychroserpens sp.]